MIISESGLQAQQNGVELRHRVASELRFNSSLAARIEQTEPPLNQVDEQGALDDLPANIASASAVQSSTRTEVPPLSDASSSDAAEITLKESMPFNTVLSNSRVYRQVRNRGVDGSMTVLTVENHASSIMSGSSLADASMVAVINLPLSECELLRLRRLARLDVPTDSPVQSNQSLGRTSSEQGLLTSSGHLYQRIFMSNPLQVGRVL